MKATGRWRSRTGEEAGSFPAGPLADHPSRVTGERCLKIYTKDEETVSSSLAYIFRHLSGSLMDASAGGWPLCTKSGALP